VTRGPTGGRGPPTVLEFLVINFSVCLVLLSNCYIIIKLHCMVSSSTVDGRISVARSSKFLLISASYLLF